MHITEIVYYTTVTVGETMNYKLENLKVQDLATVSGVQTRYPVSKNFSISAADSQRLTIDIITSETTTAAGASAFFLESSLDGGTTWDFTALETIAVTTNASRAKWTMQANRSASGVLLRPTCRVVWTSDNAGNSVVVTSVLVSRRNNHAV